MKKRKEKKFFRLLVCVFLLTGILCGLLAGCGTEEERPGTEGPTVLPTDPETSGAILTEPPVTEPPATLVPTEPTTQTPTLAEGSSFQVHFLDVGQADCALILCDGKAMLIDGGNSADSSLVFSYLKKHNVTYLDYIVATHAHEDHIGGLAGALNFAKVGVAYCPVDSYDSESFRDFEKYLEKQEAAITIPKAGDRFALGSAQVEVLGLMPDATDHNNASIVLRIVYGNTAFLFTGDAEREAEQKILDGGYRLNSTVLKVGHHGSKDSTTYPFLREIMPEFAVISVGTGNSYGHPTEDALSRLRDAGVQVYRTDLQGTIICTSDGEKVSFVVERNQEADPFQPQAPTIPETQPPETQPETTTGREGRTYILNTNTMKFHFPSCSSAEAIKPENRREFFGTREELIAMGYSPCGRCHP